MKDIKQCKDRADYEELIMDILSPLKTYYSGQNTMLFIKGASMHYEYNTSFAEVFSSVLWGLVPMLAGGSSEPELEEIYRRGIAAGTNPDSSEYWGDLSDYDHRMVEMAAIAYGMLLVPEVLWEPLSEKEKLDLAKWLDQINRYKCQECNWQFFNILVNTALKRRGREYNQQRMNESLDRIESYYQKDGWYTDGEGGQKDYYISFAIHYYSIIYANFMKEEDPVRCERFIKRAHVFAKEFIYWFAEDGSSIPYGRSLTYRFAQISFFSMCTAFKIPVLSLPVMKGIIIRNLDDWLSAPIFDKYGLLTIGYKYPNHFMAEDYNTPGSPYWSLKAFAFMMVKAEDEFWITEAEEFPELYNMKVIADNSMIISRRNGIVTAYVSGAGVEHEHIHMEEKYNKFTYSTNYGISMPRSQKNIFEAAADCVLSFELLSLIYVKKGAYSSYIHEDGMDIGWQPVKGIDVKTSIRLTEYGHIRTHTIESEYDCIAYDSGFSIFIGDDQNVERGSSKDYAFAKNDNTYCTLELLKGIGEGIIITASPNTNIVYSKTVIPAIKYQIKRGIQVVSAYVYHG